MRYIKYLIWRKITQISLLRR